MATESEPLVVILGPTGTGKSDLAMELAEKFDGEIICADSRTIYCGMDIGTAKPSQSDRAHIAHHILDIVEPSETFSAAAFKKRAQEAIATISQRGKLPIIVGGTGLYIDSILFDFQFGSVADQTLRASLTEKSIEELTTMIIARGLELPENIKNKRYLVRTLERNGAPKLHSTLRPHTLVLGKQADKKELHERLLRRVKTMIAAGFIDEVRWLVTNYGEQCPGAYAPGYKAFIPYLRDEISLQQAEDAFVKNDMQLAKRQATWFRRPIYQNSIHWVDNRSETVDLVTTFLNK